MNQALTTPAMLIMRIKKKMEAFMENYPGYILHYGGEYEDTQDSMRSLGEAFILALFLIYMIIASTFKSFIQPFMLMFTIPLAIMGVFLGLIIIEHSHGDDVISGGYRPYGDRGK